MGEVTGPEGAEPPVRGRKRDANLDRRVLEAAQSLVAEHGVRGSSVSAIAQRAAVGKPSVYLRWPNHTSILVAAIADAGVAVEPPATSSTVEALTHALDDDHEALLRGRHSAFLRSVLFESAFSPELSDALWESVLDPRRDRLTSILRADPAIGASRRRDALVRIADLLHAPLLEALARRGDHPGRHEIATRVATVIEGVGVRSQPAGA
ncbi:MAG: TetR/AcrR family transcriptional regulator [Thermoleophilia bacterium]|nr:TetR/AcrR family transcriptional regulator [Thermoleophilia bacterium]